MHFSSSLFAVLTRSMDATGIYRWAYSFRFLFIIIPGLGYIACRIYRRQD